MTEYSSAMQAHLFVYGTLMRGFNNAMTKLLSRSAEFCGQARCQGRLYLVTHYPGMVRSDDAADVVFGELFSLHSPQASFLLLDDYEGAALSAAAAARDAAGRNGQ